MPEPLSRSQLWAAIHAERAALATDLAELTDEQWASPSLCAGWSVQDVVAHLSAAALTGRVAWVRSILGARFDMDLHNDRRLREQRGATPQETLERFRAAVTSTTAASGHTPAWLGEVVVHAEDIRRPLGIPTRPAVPAVVEVARFYLAKDFAVPSRTRAKGLRLEATDSDLAHGQGPIVRGTTLALVMAMAGRTAHADELSGPGREAILERAGGAARS